MTTNVRVTRTGRHEIRDISGVSRGLRSAVCGLRPAVCGLHDARHYPLRRISPPKSICSSTATSRGSGPGSRFRRSATSSSRSPSPSGSGRSSPPVKAGRPWPLPDCWSARPPARSSGAFTSGGPGWRARTGSASSAVGGFKEPSCTMSVSRSAASTSALSTRSSSPPTSSASSRGFMRPGCVFQRRMPMERARHQLPELAGGLSLKHVYPPMPEWMLPGGLKSPPLPQVQKRAAQLGSRN